MTSLPPSADKSATVPHQTLDHLSSAIHKTVEELNAEAAELMQHSSQTLHEQANHLRAQAKDAHEKSISYIQHDPVKAVLIAAATGAAMMVLSNWLSQRVK
jgi:ElaB/YqjD/DUF883 family membrane-anchored ribosome-binding protein